MNCIKGIPPIIKLNKCISRWPASNPDTVLQKRIIKTQDLQPINDRTSYEKCVTQTMKNIPDTIFFYQFGQKKLWSRTKTYTKIFKDSPR
jgi:hypothetical protein